MPGLPGAPPGASARRNDVSRAPDSEGAAPQDRPDRANTDTATVTPPTSILLQHALASGDPAVIAVVRRIADGRTQRQAESIRAHRERLFDPAGIDRLEMDDRRRDAARRLPRLCDDRAVHLHRGLVCGDPLAGDLG